MAAALAHNPAFAVKFSDLRTAARNREPISGATHTYYRYPARFSPIFARSAIVNFSQPGQTVLDPYMGGGTTVVEAIISGRQAIGVDLNELAVFVARAKTTVLTRRQRSALLQWCELVVPTLLYNDQTRDISEVMCEKRTFNLSLPRARAIKKLVAMGIAEANSLPGKEARTLARCALLNTAQWALNGRKRSTTLAEFRMQLQTTLNEMLIGERAFAEQASEKDPPKLINANAADIANHVVEGTVDLVVTSPPYPGIHMLYHRWQVDGRRETPAPYWIANCQDGQGASYYNFADRRDSAQDGYFAESLRTLAAIRRTMKRGAYFVQMIAFSDPNSQLRRYLQNMENAGFAEVRLDEVSEYGNHRRIWREVPSRRWHANYKGQLNSSREVVLIHQAS